MTRRSFKEGDLVRCKKSARWWRREDPRAVGEDTSWMHPENVGVVLEVVYTGLLYILIDGQIHCAVDNEVEHVPES